MKWFRRETGWTSEPIAPGAWVNFNQGTCIHRWLPVIVIRPDLFYVSLYFGGDRRLHIVFGGCAVRGRGVSWKGRNIFSGRDMWEEKAATSR